MTYLKIVLTITAVLLTLHLVKPLIVSNTQAGTEVIDENEEQKEITETEKLDAIYLSLTENNLKTIEALISSVRWTFMFALTVGAIVIALLVFLGFKYAFPIYISQKVDNWMATSGIPKELNRIIAKSYEREGVDMWKKGNIDRAIELTKLSHTFLEKAFSLKPPTLKEEEIQWGFSHGNLAYYYAECKASSKSSVAFNFANIALEIGKRHGKLDLIEDFLFVVREYDVEDKEIFLNAKKIYDVYRKKFIEEKTLNESDIQQYDTFFNSND